jgi:CheY-like chemotaxis protein
MMVRMLQEMGHTCVGACDGASAVARYCQSLTEDKRFDVILME